MKETPKHIGILGGGQLGRMLIQSALDLNLEVSVLDPDPEAPCKHIAHRFETGSITHYQTVLEFGRSCQLVSIEIENVNTDALKQLVKEGIPVYPQPEVIELIQDKRTQKLFYRERGIPTADFVLVDDTGDLKQLQDMLPAFFKLGKAGYDGRGVHRISVPSDFEDAPTGAGLLERLVDFQKEIAVIVARNGQDEVCCFPTVELVFHPQHHLVEYLFAPADLDPALNERAQALARKLIRQLDMVGILAVEMFLNHEGQLLVNEIAPRPHNSGHHTIEANMTSQYQQHLRAILNLPLGSTHSHAAACMVNLLGAPGYQGPARYQGLEQIMAIPGAHVHLYGKQITRPFRKMGHVTLTGSDMGTLKENARIVKENLIIIS